MLAVDPGHGTRSNALEKALRSRNRILDESPHQQRWLDAVEREIASMISESAIAEAERRSKARDDIPEPTDLYHRAVARVMDGHEAARRIAVKARQDEALAEMKANRR